MPGNQRSAEAIEYRKWYSHKAWKTLRSMVFARDLYTCQECGKIDPRRTCLVADHITPHKGDWRLFWEASNLQTLCQRCHNSHKQSLERGGRGKPATGADGWPVAGGGGSIPQPIRSETGVLPAKP